MPAVNTSVYKKDTSFTRNPKLPIENLDSGFKHPYRIPTIKQEQTVVDVDGLIIVTVDNKTVTITN